MSANNCVLSMNQCLLDNWRILWLVSARNVYFKPFPICNLVILILLQGPHTDEVEKGRQWFN